MKKARPILRSSHPTIKEPTINTHSNSTSTSISNKISTNVSKNNLSQYTYYSESNSNKNRMSSEKSTNDEEIVQLRNQLIKELLSNKDISNSLQIPLPKLLKLQQNVSDYVNESLQSKDYQNARTAILLAEQVTNEIQNCTIESKTFKNHLPPAPIVPIQSRSASNKPSNKSTRRQTSLNLSLNDLQTRPITRSEKNRSSTIPNVSNDPIVISFDLETASKERELMFQQQLRLEDFEERWKNNVQSFYNRQSPEYYALEQKLESLENKGELEKAEKVNIQLLELKEKEKEQNEKLYTKEYKASKKKLFEKFDSEKAELNNKRTALRSKAVARALGINIGPVQRLQPPALKRPLYLTSKQKQKQKNHSKTKSKNETEKVQNSQNDYEFESFAFENNDQSTYITNTETEYETEKEKEKEVVMNVATQTSLPSLTTKKEEQKVTPQLNKK